MRGVFLISALLAGSLAAAGCQQSDNQLAAVTATPVPKAEGFTGTVPVGGTDFKLFTVTVSDTAAVTLSSTAPNATATVVLGIGTPTTSGSTTTCTILSGGSVTAVAGAAPQLSGTLVAGPYCVQVQDVLSLGPLTYSVIVLHS